MKTTAAKQNKSRQTIASLKSQNSAAATRASRATRRAPKARDVAVPAQVPIEVAPALLPTRKKTIIEMMMRRPEGCTVSELTKATGWQAHSLRAAMTGLRKAGHTIERAKNEGPSRYRIVEVI